LTVVTTSIAVFGFLIAGVLTESVSFGALNPTIISELVIVIVTLYVGALTIIWTRS
jgi:hypothetical protein